MVWVVVGGWTVVGEGEGGRGGNCLEEVNGGEGIEDDDGARYPSSRFVCSTVGGGARCSAEAGAFSNESLPSVERRSEICCRIDGSWEEGSIDLGGSDGRGCCSSLVRSVVATPVDDPGAVISPSLSPSSSPNNSASSTACPSLGSLGVNWSSTTSPLSLPPPSSVPLPPKAGFGGGT